MNIFAILNYILRGNISFLFALCSSGSNILFDTRKDSIFLSYHDVQFCLSDKSYSTGEVPVEKLSVLTSKARQNKLFLENVVFLVCLYLSARHHAKYVL